MRHSTRHGLFAILQTSCATHLQQRSGPQEVKRARLEMLGVVAGEANAVEFTFLRWK